MPINSILPLRRQLLLALLIAALSAGCGFHLKGYGRLSPALDGLYIAGFEKRETLAAVLYDNLQGIGTVLAGDPASARLRIEVVEEKFTSRVLSVDAGGKALDKELHLLWVRSSISAFDIIEANLVQASCD